VLLVVAVWRCGGVAFKKIGFFIKMVFISKKEFYPNPPPPTRPKYSIIINFKKRILSLSTIAKPPKIFLKNYRIIKK
jgi:hypothetical protein